MSSNPLIPSTSHRHHFSLRPLHRLLFLSDHELLQTYLTDIINIIRNRPESQRGEGYQYCELFASAIEDVLVLDDFNLKLVFFFSWLRYHPSCRKQILEHEPEPEKVYAFIYLQLEYFVNGFRYDGSQYKISIEKEDENDGSTMLDNPQIDRQSGKLSQIIRSWYVAHY